MRKFSVSLVVLLVPFFAQAQDGGLSFKGIPVGGNCEVFARNLASKGLRKIDSGDNSILFRGNFMAEPDVFVFVRSDPVSRDVTGVSAYFEVEGRWSAVDRKYFEIVDAYSEKYGEPTAHRECFGDDDFGSDYRRLYMLSEGKCLYMTVWNVGGGVISIAPYCLKSSESRKYMVGVHYFNLDNMEAMKKTALEDI